MNFKCGGMFHTLTSYSSSSICLGGVNSEIILRKTHSEILFIETTTWSFGTQQTHHLTHRQLTAHHSLWGKNSKN